MTLANYRDDDHELRYNQLVAVVNGLSAGGGGGAQATLSPSGSDDTALIQAALSGVDAGARVLLSAASVPFTITDRLTIAQPLTLAGESMCLNYGRQNGEVDPQVMPIAYPFMYGSVINQVTAAKGFYLCTVSGAAVHLRDLGHYWGASGDSIIFQNTGHGFESLPPSVGGGFYDQGIMGMDWHNVCFYGVDGNHYAYKFTNAELGAAYSLRWFGGGGLYEDTNAPSPYSLYGNLKIFDMYGAMCAPGTAHAVYRGPTADVANDRFYGPQVWKYTPTGTVAGLTDSVLTPLISQFLWNDVHALPDTTIDSPDFESIGGGHFNAIGAVQGAQQYFGSSNDNGFQRTPAGTFISVRGNNGETVQSAYTPGTQGVGGSYSPALAAAGAQAGASPPSPVVSGGLLAGHVTWGTGTTSGAGIQAVISAAIGDKYQTLRVIVMPTNSATQALNIYASGQSATGFNIACRSAPTDSQANTVYAADWIAFSSP